MLLSSASFAEDLSSLKRTTVPDGDIGSLKRGGAGVATAPAQVQSGTLQVTVPLCRDYISHRADVSTHYRDGVDVQGRPVAPADTNAALGSAMIPDPIRIPVTIDVAKRMGLSVQGLQMETQFPPVDVYRDGRVIWQGQDISTQIRNLCEAEVSGQKPVVPVGSSQSGTQAVPTVSRVSPVVSGEPLSGGYGSDVVR